MNTDNLLVIPHLSKELNLIGFPPLPYSVKKTSQKKTKNKNDDIPLQIVFDSQLMVGALTSICFELVKQIKVIGMQDEVTVDKFENKKMEKKLRNTQLELEKVVTELKAVKQENQILQEKVFDLEKKLRNFVAEQRSLLKRNQTEEKLLKHSLKVKESDIFKLHTSIWKNFNMADQNYLPESFKILCSDQPNLNKLWSTVKYSSASVKENALKEAVCILQGNNKALIEENFSLRTTLLSTLKENEETLTLMVKKLFIPDSVLVSYTTSELFENINTFNKTLYNKVLSEYYKIVKNICESFKEASFTVNDDLFVCWSSIIQSLNQ